MKKNFAIVYIKAAAKCIQTKLRVKFRVSWELTAGREKWNKIKSSLKETQQSRKRTN